MTITAEYQKAPIRRLEMEATNGAKLYARPDSDDDFLVALTPGLAGGLFFNKAACEEAAEFFTMLAESLDHDA